ncbi:MAG: antibiotic biosynthesis monooxygenase [Gammaproteobacteria bacterium]
MDGNTEHRLSRLLPDDPDAPVTVMVTRRPKPGKEQEFEDYIAGITRATAEVPGHLGASVLRNEDNGRCLYRIVYRFDKRSNLDSWEASPERQHWHERAEAVSETPEISVASGLEAWFDLPTQGAPHPPKSRLTFVIWVGIYFLVSVYSLLVGPFLDGLPMLLRIAILTGLVVPTMTYFVLPTLTRWFKPWLYPRS